MGGIHKHGLRPICELNLHVIHGLKYSQLCLLQSNSHQSNNRLKSKVSFKYSFLIYRVRPHII